MAYISFMLFFLSFLRTVQYLYAQGWQSHQRRKGNTATLAWHKWLLYSLPMYFSISVRSRMAGSNLYFTCTMISRLLPASTVVVVCCMCRQYRTSRRNDETPSMILWIFCAVHLSARPRLLLEGRWVSFAPRTAPSCRYLQWPPRASMPCTPSFDRSRRTAPSTFCYVPPVFKSCILDTHFCHTFLQLQALQFWLWKQRL